MGPDRQDSALLLLLMTLLAGCLPGTRRGERPDASPRAPVVLAPGVATGGSGFTEHGTDAFQVVQEASGLGEGSWHPSGGSLSREQARRLLEGLSRTPVTPRSFAPRRALHWLLREVLAGGERVEYADLKWRAERFAFLVLVRPDGYLVTALSGTPLQRQGPLQLVEGEWRVGRLAVGDFYFSLGGVFYPVNDALRRGNGPPLGELGLGRDPLNAALDGAQDAMGELVAALATSLLHPIRTVEDLTQLPTTLARLIASSPEYFARYGAMSREDQIREAARLSTHLLTLLGGAEATAGRLGGLGAELPTLSLSARGEWVVGGAVAAGGTATAAGMDLGALSILHMAGSKGQGNAGSASGRKGASAPSAKGPGKWTYKKPTTGSEQALDYQEQVTGRPAWYVYMIEELEFDGFNGKALLEAKGPGYCAFFNPDGTPKYWYVNSGKFGEMMEQAEKQSQAARNLGLTLRWHVADAQVAEFLGLEFKSRGLANATVLHTPPGR